MDKDKLQHEQQQVSTVTTQLAALAAALEAEITRLATPPTTSPTHGPRRKERLAGPATQAQSARFVAARAALALAQALLADDSAASQRLIDEIQALHQKLVAYRALGQGWLELRPVYRTVLAVERDEHGEERIVPSRRAFGPYLYYRWNEGGRSRSLYLGKPEEAQKNLWKLDALGVDVARLRHADLIRVAGGEDSVTVEDKEKIHCNDKEEASASAPPDPGGVVAGDDLGAQAPVDWLEDPRWWQMRTVKEARRFLEERGYKVRRKPGKWYRVDYKELTWDFANEADLIHWTAKLAGPADAPRPSPLKPPAGR